MSETHGDGIASVDPKLLESLVCPITHGPLEFDRRRGALISRKGRLVFPIRAGVPIMLRSEAMDLED
ncbi:MAG: Trm112 family protein [Pseudomonadota bacterium]